MSPAKEGTTLKGLLTFFAGSSGGSECYATLHHTTDRDRNLGDMYLSWTPNRADAKAFSRPVRTVAEIVPDRVATDRHCAYLGAIEFEVELGREITFHTNCDFISIYDRSSHTLRSDEYGALHERLRREEAFLCLGAGGLNDVSKWKRNESRMGGAAMANLVSLRANSERREPHCHRAAPNLFRR